MSRAISRTTSSRSAIFKPVHDGARRAVMARHRAHPVVVAAIERGEGAFHRLTRIDAQRRAEPVADRWFDEADLRPAGAANALHRVDFGETGRAERRQKEIDHVAADPAHEREWRDQRDKGNGRRAHARIAHGNVVHGNVVHAGVFAIGIAARRVVVFEHPGHRIIVTTDRGQPKCRRPRSSAVSGCLGDEMPDTPTDTARQVFDRATLRRRRDRAIETLPDADFLLAATAEDFADRLGAVLRDFSIAVDLSPAHGYAAAILRDSGKVGHVVSMAPTPATARREARLLRPAACLAGDLEALPFAPESLDLAVSLLGLHWVNDLPGTLVQLRRALRPDGLFLAALIGGQTLTELRAVFLEAEVEITGGVSPRVAPFADLRDMGGLLQRAGFALPVVDSDTITVRYGSPLTLLQDLRKMGATNALADRARTPLRRDVLGRAMALYGERHADPDGKVRATFEVLWVSGWAPHDSQQKPLRPGSAKLRLADALGTEERSAGEKAGG